jgi:hypothetical protein
MADKYSTKITCERYFRINSAEPINPEDIEISVNYNGDDNDNHAESVEEPNLLVMSILWAYYQACEQGLLKEGLPAPWEEIAESDEDDKWVEFLKCINSHPGWSNWIEEPQKAKEHIIEIYNKLTER